MELEFVLVYKLSFFFFFSLFLGLSIKNSYWEGYHYLPIFC